MADVTDAAVSHQCRVFLIVLFGVAFPLCLAHGILAEHILPAVGLVPQAVSAVVAALLLRLRRRNPSSGDEPQHDEHFSYRNTIAHPVAVFAFDVVLAAAFMIVLVFTWTNGVDSPALSMLAAYATLPLLCSFFIHLYLALLAFYHGLAIHSLVEWVAWRAVPPDCPNCNTRLRTSLPDFPWLQFFRRTEQSEQGYAPVLADDSERYRDDADVPVENTGTYTQPEQPEAVEVRSKNKKGKSTPALSDVALPWDE